VSPLPSGRLLIAGGELLDAGVYSQGVDDSWLYSADSGFTSTGRLNVRRVGSLQVSLPDGRVLAVGGDALDFRHYTFEVYDESQGTWSMLGSLPADPVFISVQGDVLPDGRVAVSGAFTATDAGRSQLIDPDAGRAIEVGLAPLGLYYGTATALLDGTVLFAGGHITADEARLNRTVITPRAFLFDPDGGTWSETGSMSVPRSLHTATRLPDGTVLIAGGTSNGSQGLTSAELYSPATRRWSPAKPMAAPRIAHSATLLSNGDVLVAGGASDSTLEARAERFSVDAGTWRPAGVLSIRRYSHGAGPLPGGSALVVGGIGPGVNAVPTAERYVPCR
jgi:hypothetical protein